MKLRLAFLYSFGQTGGDLALKFLASMIIARLLLPNEVGVFAVALSANIILHALRDFGVGRYLIQVAELTESKIRTVYGVAFIMGWSMAALMIFGRHWAAEFYGDPRVEPVFLVMGIAFAISPISQPTVALLRREQKFGKITGMMLTTALLGALVSITCAWFGLGPISLAFGVLTEAVILAAMAIRARPETAMLRPSLKEWRDICGFGAIASALSVIVTIGMQLPELLMGRFLGFTEVGLFSRGQHLSKFIVKIIGFATYWVNGAEIGARKRSGTDFGDLVLRTTDYSVIVTWPGMIFLAIKAEAILLLLYGPNWTAAAPLVQVLCLTSALFMITQQSFAVYEGTGAIKLHLRNEIPILIASVVFLLIGLQYGLMGVVWSRVALALFRCAIEFTFLKSHAGVGLTAMAKRLWRSAAVSAVFAAVLIGLVMMEEPGMHNSALIMIGEAAIMGVVLLGLLFAVRHPFGAELMDLLRALLRRTGLARS